MSAISGTVGAILGGKSQEKAAGKAADAQTRAAQIAADTQMRMYEQSRADTAGQRKLFDDVKHRLMASTGQSSEIAKAYDPWIQKATSQVQDPQLAKWDSVAAPILQTRVNTNFENDPIYQKQKEEMMRTINRRSAAGGKTYSSDADNAIARNSLALMQDSYGRQIDQLNRANANQMAMYGVRGDQYNRYNDRQLRNYGSSLDRYGRAMNAINSRFELQNQANQSDYSRYLDMAKIGSGAAATAGQNAMATGRGIAETQLYAGNANANAALTGGVTQANMWNTIGQAPGNALNNYMMYQQQFQPQQSYKPNYYDYSGGYNPSPSGGNMGQYGPMGR